MWGLADVARLVRNGKRVQVGGVVGGRHHHHHYGSGALLSSVLHQRGYRSSVYSKMSQGNEKEGSSPASEGASAAGNNADANNEETAAEEDGSKDQKGGESDVSGMDLDELRELVEKMQTKEQEYRTQIDDLKDKMVRTLADMENLRDRTSRQLQEARQFATQSLVKSLVEVADNLERAAGSILKDENMDEMDVDRAMTLLHSLRDGVIMTDGILMKILEKEGVKRFDPLGHQFDPNVHNALFEVPDATKEPGTVAVVIKKGYMLHDRAVRAADVGVVKASD
jgi:molecular chaperone GrpE